MYFTPSNHLWEKAMDSKTQNLFTEDRPDVLGAERAAAKAERLAPEWLSDAENAIHAIARMGYSFSTDDVLDEVGPPPDGVDPRALGFLMRKARTEGRIKSCGYKTSHRSERHRGVVRLWIQTSSPSISS